MITLASTTHQSNVFSSLQDLLGTGYMQDISLTAEGQSIRAHRVILSACSQYLRHNVIIDDIGHIQNVLFDGISYDNLKIVVDFMYTGKLVLSDDNVADVYEVCKMFKLAEAVHLCETYIQSPDKDAICTDKIFRNADTQTDNHIASGRKRGRKSRQEMEEKLNLEEKMNRNIEDNSLEMKSSSRRCIRRPTRFKDTILLGFTHDEKSLNSVKISSDNEKFTKTVHQRKKRLRKPGHRECFRCHKQFNYPSQLKVHRKSCRLQDSEAVIEKQEKIENEEIKESVKNARVCDICDIGFNGLYRLVEHKHSKHNIPFPDDMKVYTCEICSYDTINQTRYKEHVLIHSNEKSHACQLCDVTFHTLKALKLHSRIHSASHVCDYCNKHFAHFYVLQVHRVKIHNAEDAKVRVHKCDLCSYETFKKKGLAQHRFCKHGKELPSYYKVYKCERCDSQFYSKSTFENHSRRHKGERPYPCLKCEKKFASKVELISHTRWHNERNVKCTYEGCGFTTVDNQHLKSHIRLIHTHKGEKPFKCHVCPYKCALKGNLVKHLRNIHHLLVLTNQKVFTPSPIKNRFVQQLYPGAEDNEEPDAIDSVSVDVNADIKTHNKTAISDDAMKMIQVALDALGDTTSNNRVSMAIEGGNSDLQYIEVVEDQSEYTLVNSETV